VIFFTALGHFAPYIFSNVDASVAGDGLAELLVVGSLSQLVHQAAAVV
jgi:hypothetical protein